MKSQTCCFTGHRILPQVKIRQIQKHLRREILRLIQKDVLFFCTGGALGFDTLAALTILELKQLYPEIRLVLVLPCKDQTRNWKQTDIDVYTSIKSQADKVVYTSEFYTPGCMYKRNRYLVDHSGYCLYYLLRNTGGTAYTVHYAKEKGLTTISVN